jgi:tryptophan halogenase
MLKVKNITVVGMGSAGWITLTYLSSVFKDIHFNIIGSEKIPIIGVGEGTTPNLTELLRLCNVDELDFIRRTNGTLKYGVNFENWSCDQSNWFHLFGETTYINSNILNNNRYPDTDIKHIELLDRVNFNEEQYYARSTELYALLKNNKSPYSLTGSKLNISHPGYAYHTEAELIINAFKHICKSRSNITFINKAIVDTTLNSDGYLKSVTLDNGEKITSDLFIDCSGFHKILINKFANFKPYNELLCDSAVAGRVFYENDEEQLRVPYTTSTAYKDGWVWVIPLYNKIGSGFVYSSKHTTVEQAKQTLAEYWQKKGKKVNILRELKFTSGKNTNQCYKNIISIGLSSGFVEPLEANSISLTVLGNFLIKMLLDKKGEWSDSAQKVYNRIMNREFDYVRDFIYSHYCLANKDDTSFWKEFKKNYNNNVTFCKRRVASLLTKPLLKKYESQFVAWNWVTMLRGSNIYTGSIPADFIDDNIYKEWNDKIVSKAKEYNTFLNEAFNEVTI